MCIALRCVSSSLVVCIYTVLEDVVIIMMSESVASYHMLSCSHTHMANLSCLAAIVYYWFNSSSQVENVQRVVDTLRHITKKPWALVCLLLHTDVYVGALHGMGISQ